MMLHVQRQLNDVQPYVLTVGAVKSCVIAQMDGTLDTDLRRSQSSHRLAKRTAYWNAYGVGSFGAPTQASEFICCRISLKDKP